jgi:hypothetical protein
MWRARRSIGMDATPTGSNRTKTRTSVADRTKTPTSVAHHGPRHPPPRTTDRRAAIVAAPELVSVHIVGIEGGHRGRP